MKLGIKRALWIAGLVILLAAGGFWAYQSWVSPKGSSSTSASGVYTQVVEVRRGDLTAAVSVVGQLQAVRQVEMVFERMSGTAELKELRVKAGQEVKAGEVLAAIDPTPYEQALEEARAALQAAEETLKELEAPATELEVAQAELAVAKAQVQLEQAKAELASIQSPDLAKLERNVESARLNLQIAQLQQTLAEHESLAKNIRDLQYAVNWYQRRIRDLEALVSKGKANLEQTQELATAQEKLGELQANLALYQSQHQLSLQSAALAVSQAQKALAEAEEALVEGRAGGDALAVAQARLAVQEVEVALRKARQDRDELVQGPDEAKLASARADVERKRLALQEAQRALEGTKLVAPFDGTVLAVHVDQGDRISANTVVLVLADLGELEVVASVDETVIRQVRVGQPAIVTFDALPGKEFRGQVKEVPLRGELQGGVTVYSVPIRLEGVEGQPLLVGMTANVVIQVGQVRDALLVPALALQRVSGAYQVLVEAGNGEAVAVPVEVGLSDGTYVQVVRGLNEGDRVVVQMSAGQSNIFGQMRMMMGPEAGGPPPGTPAGR